VWASPVVALEVAGSIPVAHPTDSPFPSGCCGDGIFGLGLVGGTRVRIGPSGASEIEEREILLVVRDHVRLASTRPGFGRGVLTTGQDIVSLGIRVSLAGTLLIPRRYVGRGPVK
jgi:hypothetical protein